MVSKALAALSLLFVFACLMDSSEGWSGHYQMIRRLRGYWNPYCRSWYYWWGCSYYYRYYPYRWWPYYYHYEYRCRSGWTHNGNYNCNIPVCRPYCANGGICQSPNKCRCTSVATGSTCQTPTCSYKLPCYPGNCYDVNKCECDPGFKSKGRSEGCLSFDESDEQMYPTISRCTASIMNVRRVDNRTNFMFTLDGTNKTETETVWSNQQRFNVLSFDIESTFPDFEMPPDRPAYVFKAAFGIVGAQVQVNITKISRSGSPIRDPGIFTTYQCPHLSDTTPETDTSNCTIHDDQFKTLIEHGDWMEVRYQATSGGSRELSNTDRQNEHYRTDSYKGLTDIQEVKFLFDFIAPKYCEESDEAPCPQNAVMLKVEEEVTQNPIKPYWLGWADDLSGLSEYYVEIFRLLPDPFGRLIERHPIDPLFSIVVPHQDDIEYPEYTPDRPGIYSVLMETRDMANNSRIARRFVIYDSESEVTLNTGESGKLYVSSANPLSDYNWQTTVTVDGRSTITVNWDNHFINRVHENGRFLNEILEYPIQFKEIQDDGVLFSQKFVAKALDDHEGRLTRAGITNFHGIVKFQVNKVFTLDTDVPMTGWEDVSPLAENHIFSKTISDGNGVRIWVRAIDVMGHERTDSTYVRIDTSAPALTDINSTDTNLNLNFDGADAKYNYTSRITFKAVDSNSGVHQIQYEITLETFGKNDKVMFIGNKSANFEPKNDFCAGIDGVCYIPEQTLDLDNCWFMVAKEDLEFSMATVSVTAYNRAMLGNTIKFEIQRINILHGLEQYSGPENFHIEKTSSGGFRVAWDLPDKVSCYGLAEIVLAIVSTENGQNKTEVIYVPRGKTYFDMLGTPNTKYTVSPAMQLIGGNPISTGVELDVQTPEAAEVDGGVSGGVVGGVAAGVIVLVAVVLVVFILLIRRGHFQPVRRGVTRAKTIVARKARETFYGEVAHPSSRHGQQTKYAYDNRASELYIYGGMDFDDHQSWHIPRSDVTLDTVLKSGHFANIYKASLNRNKKTHEPVAAKTLKESFSETDETLMKAKINFTATVVGNHPNVIKFIGAVVDDTAMGPFIIYEYCEHGPLKEYLQAQKSNVTLEVQESLFRFGLDIAKGMEFLASKRIVHRRLAARNILLTFLNEIKIAGFGPQPVGGGEEDGDAEQGKKERIPIKWMGPECMASTADATEKTDVWSYAVVLWEIFTLGSSPYENIRSRDLSGRLKKGERLQQPENCDDTWYGVMKQCWSLKPDKRPTFSDIRTQLDELFVAAPGDDYYYYKH